MLAIGTIMLFASISNAIQETANQAPDMPGRRAIFPPKGSGEHPEDDPEAGLPKLPAYHPVPEGPNQDPSQSDPHALDPNSCLSEEWCEQILDVAKELVESLADALQDFLQSSTSSSTPAFSTPAPVTASTDVYPSPMSMLRQQSPWMRTTSQY